MLNYIWGGLLLFSFLIALITGNIEQVTNELFNSSKGAVQLCIEILGILCFWNGIMKIIIDSNLVNKISKILQPLLNKLFPEVKNEKARKYISLNIISNILGLGNAATPMGLNAVKEMQKNNKNEEVATNEMARFIVLNTASIQIIPTTIIALRTMHKSNNPTEIVVPILITSLCAVCIGLIASKLLEKRF